MLIILSSGHNPSSQGKGQLVEMARKTIGDIRTREGVSRQSRFCHTSLSRPVSFAAVFRDVPKDGCEGDYVPPRRAGPVSPARVFVSNLAKLRSISNSSSMLAFKRKKICIYILEKNPFPHLGDLLTENSQQF